MKLLFAPWRMQYVKDSAKTCECFLCPCREPSRDPDLVVFRGTEAFVVLNRYPYVSGHVMIVPYRHLSSPTDLTASEMVELGVLVQRSMRAITAVYGPQGFNIGMNVGQAAGAGLKDHIHVHVVPRWNGDTNFVPVIGDVKIIPESLDVTRERLERAFREQEDNS
jgi:ATP adenylyltransferase